MLVPGGAPVSSSKRITVAGSPYGARKHAIFAPHTILTPPFSFAGCTGSGWPMRSIISVEWVRSRYAQSRVRSARCVFFSPLWS